MGPKGQLRGTMVAFFSSICRSSPIILVHGMTPLAPFITGANRHQPFPESINLFVGPLAHFSLILFFSSVRNVGKVVQCRRRTTHSSLQKFYWGRREE